MKKQFITTFIIFVCLGISISYCQSDWEITATSKEKYMSTSVANGMIGILPSKNLLQIEYVVLNGVFDRYGRGKGVSNIVEGITFANLNLVFPDFKNTRFANDSDITNWKQTLDLRHGTFKTDFDFCSRISVSQTIIPLRHLPYTSLIVMSIKALEDVTFTVKNDMKQGNVLRQVSGQYDILKKHNLPLISMIAETPVSKEKIIAVNSFIFPENNTPILEVNNSYADNQSSFKLSLKKGETYEFTMISSQCAGSQFDDPLNEAKRLNIYAFLEEKERLIQKHNQAWDDLWNTGDIVIEGNPKDQLEVRSFLYYLYSFVREETGMSLSPMGLSGSGYNGHIFWDTEIWMFPPLLMLQPKMAKSILDYRFNRLDAAKKNAQMHGYKGAMFPWESADSGAEETPYDALSGPFEHHITADIGIAFWNYYLVTKDEEWLREKGYPVMKEVADFWVSRTEKNNKGEYEIKNVVCADEFAENVDNNAFTNGAAIVALQNANKAALVLKKQPDPMWLTVSQNIPIRKFDDGTIKEHETYTDKKIKQADVDLLSYPLGIVNDTATMRKNLTFYSSHIAIGPAMTQAIFSIVANRLNDCSTAYNFFHQSYKPNQRPPFGVITEQPNSHNPYFATGAGGILQSVINGFGGLEITDAGIKQVKSCLPKEWKSLTIIGVGKDEKVYSVKR